MFGITKARRLFAEAQALSEKGDELGAKARYEAVLRIQPRNSEAWWNLGLVLKGQHRWRESIQCWEKVLELAPEEAAWWNMGIAATALRDWSLARRSWIEFGIELPDGDGPIDGDFGQSPFRINPDGDAEVVWGHRLDPARARLDNIPFRESGFRWRDIILNDGDPQGSRRIADRDYPVFNVLERWEPSAFETFEVTVSAKSPDEMASLEALTADHEDIHLEDWSSTVRYLCAECSAGTPHQHEDQDSSGWRSVRHIGVAARTQDDVLTLLQAWTSMGSGRLFMAIT